MKNTMINPPTRNMAKYIGFAEPELESESGSSGIDGGAVFAK